MPRRPSWLARGRTTMTSNMAYKTVPATKPVTFTSEAAWDDDIKASQARIDQDKSMLVATAARGLEPDSVNQLEVTTDFRNEILDQRQVVSVELIGRVVQTTQ